MGKKFIFKKVIESLRITFKVFDTWSLFRDFGYLQNIKISAQMEDQWKIYSIYKLSDGPLPTEITISGEAVGILDRVREPTPKHSFDPGFDTETYYHQGNTEFIFPFRVKSFNNSSGIFFIGVELRK